MLLGAADVLAVAFDDGRLARKLLAPRKATPGHLRTALVHFNRIPVAQAIDEGVLQMSQQNILPLFSIPIHVQCP